MQSSVVGRRIAAGALMTAVVVGGTAGTAMAETRDVVGAAVVVRPTQESPAPEPGRKSPGVQTAVFSWPTASATSSTKSTAARLSDPDQGVVHRAGTATRVAVIWAVAATLVMGGVLAGSLIRR
ncbi:hypothetical protein [Cryptosporangium aurantiacum]|uniref:Uncharacterized protein n=1 Tax=Cryptosporangium aurantiacum TaxID=134849 RepID=A0A1M7QN95_9ACTN|nr:hypothetical protein [Cryptosporangium aurantiacum]SHN32914.1 hypothetical protein SAMN05443668_10595 [Cryptosporangium aurantiacum]